MNLFKRLMSFFRREQQDSTKNSIHSHTVTTVASDPYHTHGNSRDISDTADSLRSNNVVHGNLIDDVSLLLEAIDELAKILHLNADFWSLKADIYRQLHGIDNDWDTRRSIHRLIDSNQKKKEVLKELKRRGDITDKDFYHRENEVIWWLRTRLG